MKHLLLLHGAIGAKDQLEPLATRLKDSYNVHTLNFAGHGGTTWGKRPFGMAGFAEDVLDYIENNSLEKVSIFGYSMGGYVGMYLAKHRPEKIEAVATLATKFHWDEETAAREVKMLDADKMEQKIPAFAEALKHRHAPNDWKELLAKTADMMLGLGSDNPLKPDDYTTITTPTLVLLGDRDKMVTLTETLDVFKALPNAKMGVLPNTPHPIEQVNQEVLEVMLRNFIENLKI